MNRYIAFEGIDASGKTTQAKLFYEYLLNKKIKAFFTKEPGGDKKTKEIRKIILNEHLNDKAKLFLFLADRAQNCENVKKYIQSGCVISDRSLFSTIAYQHYGSSIDFDFIDKANRFATGGIVPDIVFCIDVSVDTMNKRLNKKDSIENRSSDFFERVRSGYLEMSKSYSNFFIINGEKDVDDVFKDIRGIWEKI